MAVADIEGVYNVNSAEELEVLLAKRYQDANGFWLCDELHQYPTLGVFVKGDLAYLHYIPKEYDAGLRSVGNVPELKRGEMTTFQTSRHVGDNIEVLNDAIVSFSLALSAAKEFFVSKNLPTSVEWLQL